jgi:hypothetical protein
VPKEKRTGVRTLYVELSEELGRRLEALAARNRRTLKAEVVLALERHLGADPEPAPQGADPEPGRKRRQV